MDSNNGPFPSINVTTNGVKRLVIPCTSYSTPSAPPNPVGTFDLPSSQAIFVTAIPCPAVVQQSTATAAVSFLPRAVTLTVPENSAASARAIVPLTTLRPTSPLSSVRFSMAPKYPNKTVLAVRPRPSTVQAVWNPGMATFACTSTQGIPVVRATAIGTSVPAVKVIQARPNRPGTISQGVRAISVITGARVIPPISQPVFQSPFPNLGMTGSQNFRTILPAKTVIRQIPPTIVQPSTPMVSPVRSLKKTVTIRMPGNANNTGTSNVRMTQTKYALVEVTDGGKKVMRCIQLSSVDDGQCKRGVPDMTDEPEQTENPAAEDLKVIEIVPDEESTEDIQEPHEPIRENDDVTNEQELKRGAVTPPLPWSVQAGATQETVYTSPNSHGSRPGIFETLKSMTVEEASAAVAALTVPNTVVETLATDSMYNIVHRGDDHLVIENPGYSDEGDDDDATVSCDEDPGLVISEPHTLSHPPEADPSMDTSEAPSEISVVMASSSKKRSAGKGKNVAKRTGGRPHAASKNTAKRTGGRPMTALERYGLDIKECHVSLENLHNTKPTVRWVHRHMFHILCCYKGQPGMRLKRLRRERAKKLARPNDDKSSEIPEHRKTRDKLKSLPQRDQQAAKRRSRTDKDSSVDVDDTTVDSSDASDMTYMPAILKGEPEQNSEMATEELVKTVKETTVASEEKLLEGTDTDRLRKRKRTIAEKSDIVIEQTGQETFLVRNAKQTGEKAEKACARKRRVGPARSATSSPVKAHPVTTSTDFGMPAAKSLNERHQITSEQDCMQLKSMTGFLQGRPSCVSTAACLISATGAGGMTSVASPRVTLAATTLGIKMSDASSLSGASSIVPSGTRNIVSASGAIQKLLERSPSCSASQLGAGHFIATSSDGRTLLIRRNVTPETPKAEFANPSKGKYYLVKTEQKAYLVPVDKIQVQQAPKSEKLILVPTTTACAVESPASVNRKSPLSQPGRSEGNTKMVVTTPPGASGEGSANVQSVQSPEPGAAYEPAVADMRQEDRISLLKEKLRIQQEKLEKMRKKKAI